MTDMHRYEEWIPLTPGPEAKPGRDLISAWFLWHGCRP